MTLKYLKIGILAAAATVGLMAGLRKVGEMFSLEFFKKAVAVAAVMAAAGTANASTVYENQLDGSDTGTYRFDLTCSMGCEVAFFDYTGTFDTGTDGAFVDWSVLFGDTVDYLGTAAGATGTGSAWEEDLIFQITGLLFTGDKDEGPGGAGFGEDFTFTTDAAYLIFRGYISKSAEWGGTGSQRTLNVVRVH